MILRTQRGQTLILLAMWLFFGGGASSALVVYDRPASDIKKEIKRVIADSTRKDPILLDIDQWESGQQQRDKRASADREELFKTLQQQNSTRAALGPIMTRLDLNFQWMDRDFLDLRFRVKAQVTRAEWAKIVARPGQ